MAGARGYLCVAGGIDVPMVRGSRSLDFAAGFGGGFGRPLRAGDRIAIGEEIDHPNTHESVHQGGPVDPARLPWKRLQPGIRTAPNGPIFR